MKNIIKMTACILSLCLTIVCGFTPIDMEGQKAFASEGITKQIMLCTDGISAYSAESGYDYIYFGSDAGEAIKWRVLSDKTNMDIAGSDGLFVLSENLIANDISFGGDSYQGSNVQELCKSFEEQKFTSAELGAILNTSKSDKAKVIQYNRFAASENILDGDKTFLLSAEEANNPDYGFTDDNSRIAAYNGVAAKWWLRSCEKSYPYYAANVDGDGAISFYSSYGTMALRPAFNLGNDFVLFTSGANGGKTITETLSANAPYDGCEWKATVLDRSRNFSIDKTNAELMQGGKLEINYSGAKTGEGEYVSAMLVGSDGDILYYGQLAKGLQNGKANLIIPSDLAVGDYTAYVFSEQINPDYMTDYASEFKEIKLTITETPSAMKLCDYSVTSSSEGLSYSFTMKSPEDVKGVFIVALYNDDIELVGLEIVEMADVGSIYKVENNLISYTSKPAAFKIMFWNNLENLTPHIGNVWGNITEG